MLREGNSYRLCDTGQGLNRVQGAPSVSRAMHAILARCAGVRMCLCTCARVCMYVARELAGPHHVRAAWCSWTMVQLLHMLKWHCCCQWDWKMNRNTRTFSTCMLSWAACTHICSCTCEDTCACMHACTHGHEHANMRARMHACTRLALQDLGAAGWHHIADVNAVSDLGSAPLSCTWATTMYPRH